MTVFEALNSISFIQHMIKQNREVRGYQSRLAEAAGTHGSYLSRVLGGQVPLTPDQAAGLADFWLLNRDGTDYFIGLVNFERAGSQKLRNVLERQLADIRKQQENISQRLKSAKVIETSDFGIYYSAWHYSAIHMLVLISGFQSTHSLMNRLGLPSAVVENALNVLASLNLVKKTGNRWQVIESDLHLPKSSPWTPVYHANWRQRTAYQVFSQNSDAIHFTALHSISYRDFSTAKEILIQSIEKIRKIAGPSKEENVFFIGVDAYPI